MRVALAHHDGTQIVNLPKLTAVLPGGLIGYFQRTFRDCLRSAMATALQLPYDEVGIPEDALIPDTPWCYPPALLDLASTLGLELRAHNTAEPPGGRWIAVSRCFDGGRVHIWVMQGPERLFDPWGFRLTDGRPYMPLEPPPPAHGYSLL